MRRGSGVRASACATRRRRRCSPSPGEAPVERLFGDVDGRRGSSGCSRGISTPTDAAASRACRRPATRRCGCSGGWTWSIPTSLDDYRAHGGYEALRRALELGPEGVIREVTDSKLMGRGGAAFPTGRKWDAVARQPVRPHYLICNADESEPGTFKDRVHHGGRSVRASSRR